MIPELMLHDNINNGFDRDRIRSKSIEIGAIECIHAFTEVICFCDSDAVDEMTRQKRFPRFGRDRPLATGR